jgi:hypothetical protein
LNEQMITKIGKLLALAEAATTAEEAEAAFGKAQALATAHEISLATARLKKDADVKREEPITERVTIGEKGKHINKTLINLYLRIGEVNDVRAVISARNTWVELMGFPSDIATVKALAASISVQMIRFGEEYMKAGEWKNEQVYRAKKKYIEYESTRYDYSTGRMVRGYWDEEWGYYPPSAQSARASFYEGFIGTIGRRLRDARREEIKRAEAAEAEAAHFHEADDAAVLPADPAAQGKELHGVALALRDKAEESASYYAAKTKHIRAGWSGGRSGAHVGGAAGAGRAAGNRARLGGGGAVGGGGRAIGG